MSTIDEELLRARALTANAWTGLDLVEREPRPSPEEVGAVAGFGLGLDAPPLRAAVYVFDGWGAGAEAGARLETLVDGGRYLAKSVVNGALLLFAVSEETGPDGEAALRQLVRAFHGME